MARRKTRIPDGPGLYEEHERRLARRIRRQHALFIPRFVREAASNVQLKGAAQDRGYEIAVRWAELETRGHLVEPKETSIDTQFLDQLFGEGLGYQVRTTSPDAWQLEHKFTVPDVGWADAALGEFPKSRVPMAVIELKDARTDLDRDRFNGRTAVRQCWEYMDALPECPWGIVSNFSTIRLYHRSKGSLAYEEFTLQELRDRDRFNEFYCLFERGGLLPTRIRQRPRALDLLHQTENRQKEVGDDLYHSYQFQRLRLIEHLMKDFGKPLDSAIRIAQKLLDRIIFIAFCEDRELLRPDCLERAWRELPAFTKATNPRWQNFLGLFTEVDKGGKNAGVDRGYNGLLFKPDPEIDNLDLDDDPWTNGFKNFGTFDFSEEVNVEVLGHLFERSITELEKLRVGGLFALKASVENGRPNGENAVAVRNKKKSRKPAPPKEETPLSKMPKSAQRKRFGIYYTPPAFTGLIVERTVDAIVAERFKALQEKHKVDPEARENQDPKNLLAYWSACFDSLKTVTVCDPACGSGAFLIRAYDALDAHYKSVVHGLAGAGMPAEEVAPIEDAIPDLILNHNLFGVDLSVEAVEITQLALWIRSARRDKKLSDLSGHVLCGNSLVNDSTIDPKALDWHKAFPNVFGNGSPGESEQGFSCVIGNPPWEQMMLHDREFFALTHPGISTAANAADRERMIDALPKENPELYASYQAADGNAHRMLRYATESGHYPLTGKGRTNLYMCFAEHAMKIVSPAGRIGLLLPSGIATDHTTKEFFGQLVESRTLVAVYDFVNRLGLFPDVEGRLKFCVLLYNGSASPVETMDFVFWAERIEDVSDPRRHVSLSARDIAVINPNTLTCPIFRTRRDAELARAIYKRIPILVNEKREQGGSPWGTKFKQGLFNQTSDAASFVTEAKLKARGFKRTGNRWVKGKTTFLPLFEAKMTRDYDHRASWVVMNEKNAYMNYAAESTSLVDHQNPEVLPGPRYWVSEPEVASLAPASLAVAAIGFHDVARANDTRTMVGCFVPYAGYSNTLPLIVNEGRQPWRRFCCLLANLNSYAYDFLTRQKANNAHLNFFIVEQIPTLPPDTYQAKCPWSKRETLEHWISERVLKLSCTAEDMIPLAKACDFKGSRGDGVHIWKEQERAEIRAQLDAGYFHLYQIERDDMEYMLSTFTNTGLVPEDDRVSQHFLWSPGSTGEMVLEAFDRLQ